MENLIYGIPESRMKVAILEELENFGLGDNEARKLMLSHPLQSLCNGVSAVYLSDWVDRVGALRTWLEGGMLSQDKTLRRHTGKEALSAIKGVLSHGKGKGCTHPGAR